ncbi:MAG: ribosome-binding factor A [Patescibacteria group bacterium]
MKKLDNVLFSASSELVKPAARRLLKLSSLLRAELGKIMTRELETPRNVLLTISQIEIPSDYSQAKVGLSVIPFAQGRAVLDLVVAARPELQKFINQRLNTYRVPRLVFYLDDTAEKTDSLNRLLDKLN